jgi:hypothetical protein
MLLLHHEVTPMLRHAAFIAVLSFAGVSLLWSAPGTVRTRDGRQLEGDITENRRDNTVQVVSRGGTLTLPQEQVLSIDYSADLQEQYQKRLAALGPNPTVNQRLELARWLFEHREYDLAREEADRARQTDPRNADAQALLEVINRQKVLERATPVTRPRLVAVTRPATTQGAGPRLLTAEQIQTIRRAELTERDARIRIRFENNVVRRFAELKGWNLAEFATLGDFQKALRIRDEGLAEMRQDVKVLSDPTTVAEFKVVQRAILNGCAATGCHGGPGAGGFALITPADTDAATYTNFYILNQHTLQVAGVRYRLLSRLRPEDSILLQYGLPADRVQIRHKETPNWKPAFTQGNSYQMVRNWINLLGPTEPDYRLDSPAASSK